MKSLFQTAAESFDVPADLEMWRWCEDHITIPSETETPWPGRYSTSNTPWVKGWFDVMHDPKTRIFACKKGGQIAWTQTCMCAMLFWMVNDPGACLYCMDSLDNARDTSRLRLQPIISSSNAVRDQLQGGFNDEKQSSDGMMNILYQFRRSYVRFIGAQSPGKAASFTYRRLLLEEPEKYKDVVGNEGNVIASLMERVKRKWNSLVLIGCTPTTKSGFIQTYVDRGDDMMYFVNCPKCSQPQVLVFHHKYFDLGHEHIGENIIKAMIVFDPEREPIAAGKEAYLECGNANCKHHINTVEKERMIETGTWIQTRTASVDGARSCELSGLYPRGRAASIENMVQEFLTKKGNRSELQIFINSSLGELWDDSHQSASTDRAAVWQMRDMHKYLRGTVPCRGWVKMWLFVDVQERFVPWCIWAQQPRDMYLVDHGEAINFDDMSTMLDKTWPNIEGNKIKIDAVMIDTGHKSEECYKWIRKEMHRARIVPVKGNENALTGGEVYKWGLPLQNHPWIRLLSIHQTHWHDSAFHMLRKIDLEEGQSIIEAWEQRDVRVHFHSGIDLDYVKQITNEWAVDEVDKKTGSTKRVYKKRRPNDQFDLLRYGIIARSLMREDFIKVSGLPEKTDEKGKGDSGNDKLNFAAAYPSRDDEDDDDDSWYN